jgi:hypothetical protein
VFGLSLFSFRSPQRNQESDEFRIVQIWRVVRSAVADAEVESKGLRARTVNARRSAVFLVDVDGGESDPTGRVKLRGLEQYVRVAEGRLAQLKDHLEQLQRIKVTMPRLPH